MTSIIRTITAAVVIFAFFWGSFAAGYAVAYRHGWDDAGDDRFTPGRGRGSLPLPLGRLVDRPQF